MNALFWLSAAFIAEGAYRLKEESEKRKPFLLAGADANGRCYIFMSVLMLALFYMRPAASPAILSASGLRQLLFFQLLPIAWIDGYWRCIPNRLTARIFATGFVGRLWLSAAHTGGASLWHAVSFTLLIALFLVGFALLASRSFGMGDAKLLSALSLFYPPEGFLLLCVMSLCAAPIGLIFRKREEQSKTDAGLPLAPGIVLAVGLL